MTEVRQALDPDAPRGAAPDGDAVDAAARDRPRLLALRLRQRKASAASAGLAATAGAALSSAQQSLWVLDQLDGPSGVYNVTRGVRLQGPLDAPRLELGLQALVRRHESLRTGFVARDGVPAPLLLAAEEAAARIRLEPAQVEGDTSAQREQALAALMQAVADAPFDLARPPLLRAQLLRLEPNQYVLLLVLHHIVTDGWSMGVLMRELGLLYASAGADGSLPPLPARYADYAMAQHERLADGAFDGHLRYWREQLQDLEPLDLPADRPRPARASQRGAVERFLLPPQLLGALKNLARREGATLFMALLAAFQVLLLRWSRQQDFAVGVPVAGRYRAEYEPLIGYFVNTVVLRSDLAGDPTFSELLGRVRRTALQAYSHQELPFDRLVAAIAPRREAGRNPLYQTAFALQNQPAADLELEGLRVRPLEWFSNSAKFELSLGLTETPEGLVGALEYATDLFEVASAQRLVRHFAHLLEGVAADPGQHIGSLPLLDEAERRQLLMDWNGKARALPQDTRLHRLFEQQVAARPEAVALVAGARQWSYRELDERAERLAQRLRALGVASRGTGEMAGETVVGLYLQRSPALVAALLAVLKAGGAYLPLDPDYPAQRLAFMLADSGAALLLATRDLAARLPSDAPGLLCLDEDGAPLSAAPGLAAARAPDRAEGPDAEAGAADPLAYLIYTSGSTGVPKAVEITQRAVARLVLNTDYVQLGPGDCVAQASNSAFDAATFEIWGALLNGARLVIVPSEVLLAAEQLAACIARHGIGTLFLTTALFNAHAASRPGLFAPLKHLLFGGEAANPEAVRKVVDGGGPARLLHVYGPTESTCFATWYEVPRTHESMPAIPIGRPIANSYCLVLGPQRQLQPIGVVGELWLGGAGLARGYRNRPELDAQCFADDPFHPGQRLYRSGDLVRWSPQGQLVFVGRADRQVKLRGFRIELGEIEAALDRHEAVLQSAVVLCEDAQDDQQLLACLVTDAKRERPSAQALRAWLQLSLPAYMLPAAYLFVDALPVTPNGKLDREKLRLAKARQQAGAAAAPAAGDRLEDRLRQVWEETLDMRSIGLDDDFFELGGHSLKAIRLLVQIRSRIGAELPASALFQAPTVRRLAALMRQHQAETAAASSLVAVQPNGTRPPLFLVPGAGGEMYSLHALAQALGNDQPLYVLNLYAFGRNPAEPGELSLEQIAARMMADMRERQASGPYHLAGYSLGGTIVYEIAQQLRRERQAVAMLALLDCSAPGYAGTHSFARRALLHVRHGLALGPAQASRYLLLRLCNLRKYLRRRRAEPAVRAFDPFEREPEAPLLPAETVAAMRQTIAAVLRAWQRYGPSVYPAQIVLVRAESGRQPLAGTIAADQRLGWGRLAQGGVRIESLQCAHTEMLKPQNAMALAQILARQMAGPANEGVRPGAR